MFFGNMLFVIGFPFAVMQLIRAYGGGSALSRDFAGLDRANILAKNGKDDRAAILYEKIIPCEDDII